MLSKIFSMHKIIKLLGSFLVSFLFFFSPVPIHAQSSNSFVTIVNPVRGDEFWKENNQAPRDAVLGESSILTEFNLPATWLLRFDALDDKSIDQEVTRRSLYEPGL